MLVRLWGLGTAIFNYVSVFPSCGEWLISGGIIFDYLHLNVKDMQNLSHMYVQLNSYNNHKMEAIERSCGANYVIC